MEKLISIDLKADFGFLRKPDTNDGISMSYNMLHKPGLLGIFGAILGLNGYQKFGELPEYYLKLKDLKVAIAPLIHENGNFPKTTIIYTNTVGYANKDGNFIAKENTLFGPSYRVFVILDSGSPLYDHLKNCRAEYIPYLGKNEYPLWWDNFQELEIRSFTFDRDFEIKTLFIKESPVSDNEAKPSVNGPLEWLSSLNDSFFYFERLPVGFREFITSRGKEYQYDFADFAYSNARFQKGMKVQKLFETQPGEVVQLN